MKKYYYVLGLKEGASQEQIQEAYERLSKELAPANNDNQEFFVEEFKKVQEAYKALSNSSILATDKGAKQIFKKSNTTSKKNNDATKTPIAETPIKSAVKKGIIISIAIIAIGIAAYFIYTAIDAKNPIYLDDNGITIKAKKWAKVGDEGIIDGVLYTIVGLQELRNMNTDVFEGYTDNYITEVSNLNPNRVCTTFISDMSFIFFQYRNFNQDISSWDVSNVTDMRGMFESAINFNQDISSWDVSSVFDMEAMFRSAINFNQDISTWDVSNVRNCGNFSEEAPLTEANTPNFTNCTP